MFAKSVIALAVAASFTVAAPIEKKAAPANWAYGYLEDYDTYHVRYLALKCYEKKQTSYFQDCCRPLLSTQTLQNDRKAYCIPSTESTAAVAASLSAGGKASATASAEKAAESEYCESEESASVAATTTYAAASSTSTAAAASSTTEAKAVQYLAPAASSSSSSSSSSSTPAWTPAATTSTTPAWTPAPTTSTTPAWTPAPTTSTTPAAATTQAASSNSQTFNGGFATYFYQGGNAGACGVVHGDWDMIVAIDQAQWGSSGFGSGSNTCNRWLTVTNTNNGKSVVAMVADVCPTCANGNSLDLSQGAFNAIASESDGMVPISWHWN